MIKISKNIVFSFFIIFCCLFFSKGTAATIYFNQVYKGTGTAYALNTQSITGLQLVSGYSFKVVSAIPTATSFNSGNNENVILYYINSSGIQVSIYGVISRQNKTGNTTLGVNFIVSDSLYTTFTGEAYILVVPGKEASYSNGATASTSSDPIGAVLNSLLATQATAPIINSAVSSVNVLENAGYAVFTFSLTNAPTSNYSFTPNLTGVTAISGVDFTNSIQYLNGSTWQAITGALTITSTALSFQLRVPIINYNTSLTNKTFNINTGAITGGGILNNYGSYGVGTIMVPVISASGTLAAFSSCSGFASTQQSFTVSGVNLVDNLIVTPPTGYEVSTTSGSGFSSSVSLTPLSNTVSTTTIYVRLAASAINNASGNVVCSSTSAVSVNIGTGTATVIASSVAGTAAATSSTICSGNSTTVTLNGSTGSIQWQQSLNGTTGWSNVSGATSTIVTTGNLSVTTYYQALVSSGVCSSTTSNVVTVSVIPAFEVGSISGATAVCAGTNSTILSLTGNTGSVTKWQSSTFSDFSSNIIDIANTTTSLTATNLIVTTYYRAVVSNGVCSAETTLAVSITVNPLPTITLGFVDDVQVTATTFSIPYTSSIGSPDKYSLTTASNSGNSIAMAGFSSVSNATLSSSPINVTIPASTAAEYGFYLTITNSVTGCSSVYPFQFHVTSIYSGKIAEDQTICSGSAAATLTNDISGSSSNNTITYTWEKSTTGIDTGYVTISGETSSSYSPGVLTQTTYFKRVVHSIIGGADVTSDTDPITITVNPISVAGSIEGGTTVCSGINSTTLNLIGNVGIVTKWQSSTSSDFSSSIIDISNTTTSLTATNLTVTTYYRAVVTSGVCSAATTSVITMTVNPISVGGTATAALPTICSGTGTTITLSGSTGSIQWQQSLNGTTGWSNVSGATSSTLTIGSLTVTTYYQAIVTSGVCTSTTSNVATINVNSVVNGIISGAGIVCSATNNSTLLTLNGSVGSIQWQSSSNNSAFTDISGATNSTYTAINLSANTYFRAIISSVSCASATTPSVGITVLASNVWTGSVSTAWNIAANWSCGVPASGENIEIPGGLTNYPILDGTRTIGDVILGSDATINLNNLTLVVSGTFSGTGSLIGGGNSSLSINGSGNQGTFYMNQTTPGTSNIVANFTLNSSATGSATLGNAMGISGILTLTNGTFNTGGNLTLMSNGNITAVVAPITDCSAVAITGDVTVERFFPARRAFRFISSPVTTSTTIRDNWQEGSNNPTPAYTINLNPHPGYGTHITGNMTGGGIYGFDATQTTNNSMFTYNNATGAWGAIANTNVLTLTAGVPYRLLIRGDRSISMNTNAPTPTNTTLRAKGVLKICDAPAGVLNQNANGYSFIGNPYQATVDIEAVLTQNTNINPNFYWVWDPKINTRGGYVAYDLSLGLNPVVGSQINAYLQPWQACFVKNTAVGSGSISFNESFKSTSIVNENAYKSSSASYIRATLYESNTLASNGAATDGFIVKFGTNYTNNLDVNDATKLINQDEIFATKNTTTLLGIESRLAPEATDVIPLNITQYRFTNYTIVAQGTNMSGLPAYLHDQLLQTYTEIPQSGAVNYSYVLNASDVATSAPDRFRIVFQNPNLSIDSSSSLNFTMSPNPSNQGVFDIIMKEANEDTKLVIYNTIGQQVYATNLKQSSINHVNPNKVFAAGVYYVKITKDAATTIKKLIIE